MGTVQWTTFASDPATFENMPAPREYAGMTYDTRESRLVVFGGWNNGWFDDLYSLNVAKIVGPSYAITSSEPALGQLSGKSKLVIRGQGFKEPNIKVIFTNGNKPVDTFSSKFSKEVSAEFISDTEIHCLTPSFEDFGPNECVMQITIAGGDFTTTWIPFQYFLNTRAHKSLAYGPGLLKDVLVGHQIEFVIQARNDLNENRLSGNDEFEVVIRSSTDRRKEIENTLTDRGDGSYLCTYQVEEVGDYDIEINFMNDKQVFVPIRGSPYKASFKESGKATDNSLTGGVMSKQIQKEIERLTTSLADTKKDTITKGKELDDIKVVLGIKESVEKIKREENAITL